MQHGTKRQKLSKKEEDDHKDIPDVVFQQVQDPKLEAFKMKDMRDCDVYYVPTFVAEEKAQEWYASLLELESWYRPTLKVFGREVIQSRKIAAYSNDPKLTLKYSGQTVDMKYEYPPILQSIQEQVEKYLGVKFNHVMLNLYDDGTVYIGNHRDNLENKVIASLSLGAARTFVMTHDKKGKLKGKKAAGAESSSSKRKRKAEDLEDQEVQAAESQGILQKRWVLQPGSLVVMQGETQKFWKHEIPKEPKIKEGRISLTFRQLVNS